MSSKPGWAPKAPTAPFEAKAGPAADDPLRLLFKRTLRDLTPQQRRVLAGEIALVIPNENEGMQGQLDPLWIRSLRAFAQRELELDDAAQDGPQHGIGGAEARALSARISEAIGDMIDEVNAGQRVELNKDEVARRLAYTDRKGLEFVMNKYNLDWKPYQRLLRSPRRA